LNAKKQVGFFGKNGNAIALGRSALMVMAAMLPAIVVSCSMPLGKDWLIPACGRKTKTISQTDDGVYPRNYWHEPAKSYDEPTNCQ
jgi:hypothetical protein